LVGTSSGSHPLSVVSSQSSKIQFGLASDQGGFLFSDGAGSFGIAGGGYYNGVNWIAKHTASSHIRDDGDANLRFFTNSSLTAGSTFTPAERLRVTSAGLVGIGTSGPSSQLDVRGSATDFDGLRVLNTNSGSGTQTSAAIRLGITNSFGAVNGIRNCRIQATENNTDSNDVHLDFYTNSAVGLDQETVKMRLTAGGALGIGTTTVNNGVLHVKSNGTGSQAGLAVEASANDSFLSITNNGSAHKLEASYNSTGSYQPISFVINGEKARIDTSGRLLVGTSSGRAVGFTSLQAPVQVETTTAAAYTAVNNTNDANGCYVSIAKTRGTSAGAVTAVQNNDELGAIRISGSDGTGFVVGAQIIAAVDGTPGTNDLPTRLVFSTTADGASTPTERLRITSAGLVGIGTTSPLRDLHVSNGGAEGYEFGPGEASNINQTLHYNRSTSVYIENSNRASAHSWDVQTSEKMRLDTSGRLLVGTSSYTGNATIVAQGHSGDSAGPAHLLLKTGNTSPVSGGDLGYLFFGDANTSGGFGAWILGQRDGGTWTSGSSMPGRLQFATTADGASSPTERMRLSQDGRFYLSGGWYTNITTANAANVHAVSSGEFYRSTSSIKYKTDIETLQDSYADAILNVRPVWYRSLGGNDNPDHSWWGFIAEEVAEIDPRLVQWKTVDVTYDENGSPVQTPCEPEPEGVAYDRFVPHLLNLIKRQGEAIADLQAEVAALKAS
jgi:hypothetical protein